MSTKIGIVKEFCKDRGFGLIQPIDESSGKLMDKTIFVHFSEIVQDGRPPLNQSMEDRIKKLKKLTWKEDHTRGKYYLKMAKGLHLRLMILVHGPYLLKFLVTRQFQLAIFTNQIDF